MSWLGNPVLKWRIVFKYFHGIFPILLKGWDSLSSCRTRFSFSCFVASKLLEARMRHICHTTLSETDSCGVTQNQEGSTSFSQLFFLLFCTDACCTLAIHKRSAAQGPHSIEHGINQRITGYCHIRDKAQTPLQIRTDRMETPSEFCITAILIGTTSVITDIQLVAALGHCWNAEVHTFWYLKTQEIGAAAVGLLRLVAGSGHWCLSITASVLADSIFPSEKLQKGIEVAVDRFKAAPDVPKAPVWIGLLGIGAGVTLSQATPQAEPQNQEAHGQLHPEAR